MELHYGLIRAERISPPVASRIIAYGAVALYEGLAPGSPALRSLAGQLNGLDRLPEPDPGERYDRAIVGATAEAAVLKAMYGEGLTSTRVAIEDLAGAQVAARVQAGVSATVQRRSEAYGIALGQAILHWATADSFVATRGRAFRLPVGRAFWVNTTTPDEYTAQSLSPAANYIALGNPAAALDPAAADERALLLNRPRTSARTLALASPLGATEPYWGRLRPFVLRSGDECAAPRPAPYSEFPASDFYREVRAVYDASRALTDEQRRIALFWADNPGQTGTPPGHWVMIARGVIAERRLSLDEAAEAFALTAVAMADAFISCWREKYRSHVVRPVTYIRRLWDPEWQTLVVTPPFPEYTSGHSAQSAAAAEVLTRLLGDVPFTDETHTSLGHPPRRFASFGEAAREAAISRLYGGIHYPMAIENGVTEGRCIGERVMQRVQTRGSP